MCRLSYGYMCVLCSCGCTYTCMCACHILVCVSHDTAITLFAEQLFDILWVCVVCILPRSVHFFLSNGVLGRPKTNVSTYTLSHSHTHTHTLTSSQHHLLSCSSLFCSYVLSSMFSYTSSPLLYILSSPLLSYLIARFLSHNIIIHMHVHTYTAKRFCSPLCCLC